MCSRPSARAEDLGALAKAVAVAVVTLVVARVSRLVTHAAIDVADFLLRTVAEEDYVVLKLDVEGASGRRVCM